MARIIVVGLLGLSVCSCHGGEEGPSAAPFPSALTSGRRPSETAGTSASTVPQTPPTSSATVGRAPGPPNGTVTLHLRNGATKPRYVGYGRSWTEQLRIERREGTAWVPVAYEQGLCAELCPADGTAPKCGFCSPPIPVPEALVLGSFDYTWAGKEYPFVQLPGASCGCASAGNAPRGAYRATLCSLAEVHCEPAPCKPEPSGFVRRGVQLGTERACVSVEFELGAAPVDVTLDASASLPERVQ